MEDRLQLYLDELDEIMQSTQEEQALLQDHIQFLHEQISLIQNMIDNVGS